MCPVARIVQDAVMQYRGMIHIENFPFGCFNWLPDLFVYLPAIGFMRPAVLQLSRTSLAASGISSNLLALSLPFPFISSYQIFLTLSVSTYLRLLFYASRIKRSALILASRAIGIRGAQL